MTTRETVRGAVGSASRGPAALGPEELLGIVAEECLRDLRLEPEEIQILEDLARRLELDPARATQIAKEVQVRAQRGELGEPRGLDAARLRGRVVGAMARDGALSADENALLAALDEVLPRRRARPTGPPSPGPAPAAAPAPVFGEGPAELAEARVIATARSPAEVLDGLSPAARRLADTQQLTVEKEVVELLALLDELRELDLAVEERIRRIGIGTWVATGAAVLGVLAWAWSALPPHQKRVVFVVAPIIALVLGGVRMLVFRLWTRRYRELDLPDCLHEEVRDVLRLLVEDVARRDRVRLRIRLGNHEVPTSSEVRRPWLRITAPLADGTRLDVALADQLDAGYTPRMGRRKVKFKYRAKRLSWVQVEGRAPADVFRWDASRLASHPDVEVKHKDKPGRRETVLRLTRKEKRKSRYAPPAWPFEGRDLVRTILDLRASLVPRGKGADPGAL